MYDSEVALNVLERQIGDTERKAKDLGQTSAVSARQYEKLTEAVRLQRQKLLDAADAFQKGDISARRFATIVGQTENKVASLGSRLRDAHARLKDFAAGGSKAGSVLRDVFAGTLLGGGAAGVITALGGALKDATVDGIKLFGTLDRLTRFTATLDRNFQSPEGLKKFREDIQQLSTEIPFTAESIARASFTLKSAFQGLTEPQLIEYLRQFGNAAVASNTDIATHAQNVAALAKQYKLTGDDLTRFNALIASSFGQALAQDSEVAQGFNRILSAAQSTKQPLNDLIAAMSTLQSVSSDAESNTTNLLNVYSKLTDAKYIEGLKELGINVFDAKGHFKGLNDIVNELAQKLKGLSDEEINQKFAFAKDLQAREGLKTLVREVQAYNDQLQNGASTEAFEKKHEIMANSVEAKWLRLTNALDNYKMSVGAGLVDVVEDIRTARPPNEWGGEVWRGVIAKGMRAALTGAYADVQPVAADRGKEIGANLAAGLQVGIASGQSGVVSAAVNIAMAAYQSAKNALGIQSPSKLFYGIGKNVVEGFIDGIAALKASAQSAMASLLDVSQLKAGKGDKTGVELLTRLIGDLSQLNVKTKAQEIALELTAVKYEKLNAAIRSRIQLAAQEYDRLTANAQLEERIQQLLDDAFSPDLFEQTKRYIAGLAAGNEELKQRLLLLARVSALTAREGVGTGEVGGQDRGIESGTGSGDFDPRAGEGDGSVFFPPPPFEPWRDFWQMLQSEIAKFQESLGGIKQALGENIVDSLSQISGVFGQAVFQWDGTLKGFFGSVAQGFGQMAKQIIANLIRIAIQALVTKLILSLIGGFGGGGGASAGSADIPTHGLGTPAGMAGGGLVRGPGGPTSDLIPAMLSSGEFVMPAKSVRAFGTRFMESIRSLRPLALAGGGMAAFAGTPYSAPTGEFPRWSASRAQQAGAAAQPVIINNNFYANANGAHSRESAEQAARRSTAMMQRSARRGGEEL